MSRLVAYHKNQLVLTIKILCCYKPAFLIRVIYKSFITFLSSSVIYKKVSNLQIDVVIFVYATNNIQKQALRGS